MASSIRAVKNFGPMSLSARRVSDQSVVLDNAPDAAPGIYPTGRLSQMEADHLLTHTPARIFQAWPGVTTEAAYAAAQAARAGAPARVLALHDEALQFDGVNDYVDIPYRAEYYPAQWSIETWFIRLADAGAFERLVTQGDASLFDKWMHVTSADQIAGGFTDASGVGHAVSGGVIAVNVWTHAELNWDGAYLRLIVNGALVATSADWSATPPRTAARGFFLGRLTTTYSAFCRLAETRYWNYARGAGETAAAMNFRARGDEPGLLGCWPGVMEGATVPDLGPYQNHGTAYGGVTKARSGAGTARYFSEQAAALANVETLYQEDLFTGHVDGWNYSLNDFTLRLSSTERAEERELPERGAEFLDWPSATRDALTQPYPEAWGTPGPVLDAEKIGAGRGAAPCRLVSRAQRKYVMAGHALKAVAGVTSGTVAAWVEIPGFNDGYGYLEGCTFNLAETGPDGKIFATLTAPAASFPRLFIPSLTTGNRRTTTASNPTNAAGRDAATVATLAPGQRLVMALAQGYGGSVNVMRVWIATSKTSADLRVRWLGMKSTIVGTGVNYIAVDSAVGWDASGNVQVASGVLAYTSITKISETEYRLNISGYGGADTGDAIQVGAWQAVSAKDMEVTTQRDWTDQKFFIYELELENTGAGTHDIAYLGLRVMQEITTDMALRAPVWGAGLVQGGVDYGASRNPARIIADVHTRLLGLGADRIGASFESAAALLDTWKLDPLLLARMQSGQFIAGLLEQARAFLWRDASNRIQIGVYRLDDTSAYTLDSLTDIIDPEGDAFEVTTTDPEEIRNRVRLRWGGPELPETYWIDETGAEPPDTARVQAAVKSQREYRVKNTLALEAPHIQDADTAEALLRYLFDFHAARRTRLRFQVPGQVAVQPGDVIAVSHPLLTASTTYIVEELTRAGDVATVQAVSLAAEGRYEIRVNFQARASAAVWDGWGAPGFWTTWGGALKRTAPLTVGRVVDYGLALGARRFVEDTAEKPAYGAAGTGSTEPAGADTALQSPVRVRQSIVPPSRSGAVVTIQIDIPNDTGAAWSLREFGLFTAATGGNLLARVVLASALTVNDGEALRITLEVEALRPTGSSATTYGLNLLAARTYEDTAEKPTHLAIGTGNTAEAATDTALVAQIATRQAMKSGYPKREGVVQTFAAFFDAATYGGNTVREVGLFTGATGANAIARRVPAEIVLGVADSATLQMQLIAGNG